MDKKQTTTTKATLQPIGMCEKLFNTFQPTLRPVRHLTFRHKEANHAGSSHQIHQTKLSEPVAPSQGQRINPYTESKLLPSPAPPKAEVIPLGTVPQPLPPRPPKATKKGINEKVDEYITRTKGKIKNTGSKVGKVAASK